MGYSPVRTGFSFLVIPAIIAVAATNAPRLIKRYGYKAVLMVAPLFLAAGLFLLAQVPVQGHYAHDLLPGFLLMGFGLGLTFVSVAIAATSGVPGHLSGLASGLLNTAQQIGGSLGLAVLSGIAASSTTRFLQNLGHQPSRQDIAAATVHGFQRGFYIAAVFAILASVIATIFIKKPKPAKAVGQDIAQAAPTV
jgi:MFS family permease